MSDDMNLTKVGSYASGILPELHHELSQAGVILWAHGHLHHAMHYGVHGIQVAANPRGRIHRPLTRESARGFALFGVHVSDADIANSQRSHAENPELGDGFGYEKSRSLSLAEAGYSMLEESHETALQSLAQRRKELKGLRPLARSRRAAIADLAGHRADTIFAAILTAVREFAENMAKQLASSGETSRELDGLLSDCKLAKSFREFAGVTTLADFEGLVRWRALEEERTLEQRERFGYHPERYSAKSHLKSIEHRAALLEKALRRAPQACEQLRHSYLRMHRYFLSR
jgi:hypothetical protein